MTTSHDCVRCEWPIDAAGPRHGEPCGNRALAHVRFRIDRQKPGGRTIHRKVCGRHIGMALRAGWEPRALNTAEKRGDIDGDVQ